MLTAIEFVKQADGKVGEWFARHTTNQNTFMKSVITDGCNPDVISDMSEKFGTLILPVQHYSAVGGVYHQLKWQFALYQQDGIVGSELPDEKTRAPRSPRSPRKPSPASASASAPKTSPAAIAMMARKISRTAARILVVAKRIDALKEKHCVDPDLSIITLASNFRAAGKEALAVALESDYFADAEKAEKARIELRSQELSAIMAILVEEYGASAVSAAAPAAAPAK